jgi:hypothetical protein
VVVVVVVLGRGRIRNGRPPSPVGRKGGREGVSLPLSEEEEEEQQELQEQQQEEGGERQQQ